MFENKIRRKNKWTYLESLQTTECCGGALPALVILHAAVQTTAVVRLIQAVCVLQTHPLLSEDLQRFTELPRLSKTCLSASITCYIWTSQFQHQRHFVSPSPHVNKYNGSQVRASCPSANPPEGSAQHE